MEIINMSKKKYEELTRLQLPSEVLSTEAILYMFKYHGKDKVFKDLYKKKGVPFANKLFILTMLDEYRDILPDNFVLPDSLCSIDGNISGFTIPFIKGINFEAYLNNKKVLPEEKMKYFIQIGEILEQLSSIRKNSKLKCIYISDLHASNFILNPIEEKINVIDLDSCRICDSNPLPARFLTPLGLFNKAGQNKYEILRNDDEEEEETFSLEMLLEENDSPYYRDYKKDLGFVKANENSDLYCYSIMFLNFLYGRSVNNFTLEEFYNYMYYLESLKFDRELLNALYKIVSNANNENIFPYLESLTNEQVYRADNKIYKLNTKGHK